MLMKKLLIGTVSAAALASGAAYAQADQQMETVVVTGIRATIAQGLDIKRESTQVIESVVAEDIGKLPDNNVVEALQRLTGVQVTDRGAGQVGTISIRGLTDIETTWNGRKLFTASGLYFSVQDMPATLVHRLDVYKTRESNQLESGIAGQIDVQSYRPFDFDGFKLSGQARGTYEEKRGAFDPNLSLLVSDRWNTKIGDVGVLANVSWSVVRFRDQSATPGALVPFATETPPSGSPYGALERIFSGWDVGTDEGLSEASGATLDLSGVTTPYYLSRDAIFQSDFTGKRTRPNANLAIQWAPNEKSVYTLEVMYNGFRNETYNNLFFSFVDWWGSFAGTSPEVDPASSFTLYDGTNIMKTRHVKWVYGFNSGDLTVQKTNSYVYALNAKWDFTDRFKATADVSYQASQFASDFTAMRIDRVAEDIYVDFNAGAGIMAFNFGDGQDLLTDPSAWNTAQLYHNGNHNTGDAYTLQFDGTYDMHGLLGPMTQLRFGGRFDRRDSSESYFGAENWYGQSFSALGDAAVHTNSNFFDGVGDVPHSWVNVDGRWVHDHITELETTWGGNLTSSLYKTMLNNFRLNQKTLSFYAEGNFEQDVFGRPLSLNAGLRWVQAKADYGFVDRLEFLAGNGLNYGYGGAYAAKFLPSATLSYEPTDDIKLRVNYGETLRRPNFGDLNPNYILNADVTGIGYATGSRGNPNLKPVHAKNIDVGAEWYFGRSSAVYATLFRRDLEGIVVTQNVAMNFPGADILATYNTNTFIISQPLNSSKGSLKGIELGFTYFPEFLPSYLDGLGAQGSWTIMSSTQNIPLVNNLGESTGEAQQAMWGVSPMSYNITGIYEHGDFGARLSYVWRSKWLNANEARLFANPIGVWRRAESSLDFQLNYKPWDKVMVTFDVVNMLNAKQKQYYHFGSQGTPETTDFGTLLFSRSFTIGLRYATN